ncbi:MAG: PAS domain-containing protein [Caldilineaceae bacterium]|nr:PAS domain-containing protein [Caldilineaceae bacterium]
MQSLTNRLGYDSDEIAQLRQRVVELERQLAEQEQRLQASLNTRQEMADMIDRIGDVFFALDRDWRYLYVNPKATALTGMPADDILGKTLWETFPQLLGTIYEEQYRRAMEQQIPAYIEERGVVSGRWYETTVYPSARGLSIYGRDITTRKEAEESLRKQQAQAERQLVELQGIYATTPIGLCYMDTDLRYISLSDQLARWSGINPTDLIGRSLTEIATENTQPYIEILRHVIESGEPIVNQPVQAPLRDDPDQMRDWLLNYYPIRDNSGQVVGVHSVVFEVTDLKQLEREREEALALLDAFFDLAPVGLAMLDEDLRFVRINEALARMNGISVEDHLHKRPDELPLDISDLAPMIELWQRMALNGEPVRGVEVSGETPAAPGEIRYWREQWYPVYVQERMICMGVVVEEITERKLYEQSLRESEERFRHLADAMPQLVWTANPDGSVDYYNRRYREFQGFSKGAAGWDWAPTLHLDDLQKTVDAWQQAVQTGNIYEVEHRVCLANGEFEWFLSRAVPAYNAQGQIIKWYGTATNIHQNKVAAEDRERLLAELTEERARLEDLTVTLEERVRKGTEQVRTLAARLTLAEHQERKRVAQILHDHIQQMLYAVQMRIHLVELDLPTEQAGALMIQIDEMKRLTNEAIHAARTLSVELSPPILENEGLPEAIKWLNQQMKEIYGLDISLKVEGDCQVDNRNLRVMLFQVARELLFNVVKHANTQKAMVALQRSDDQIIIIVSDTGKGIDLSADSHNHGGFGLSSIRERLNLFDGLLQIESAPDQGTQVTITCPL